MERMMTHWQLMELIVEFIITKTNSTLCVFACGCEFFVKWDGRQSLPKWFAKAMVKWRRGEMPSGEEWRPQLWVEACISASPDVEHAEEQQQQECKEHRSREDDSLVELDLGRGLHARARTETVVGVWHFVRLCRARFWSPKWVDAQRNVQLRSTNKILEFWRCGRPTRLLIFGGPIKSNKLPGQRFPVQIVEGRKQIGQSDRQFGEK